MSLATALPHGHHLTVIETTPHPAQPAHPVFGSEPAAIPAVPGLARAPGGPM
jgi:hypothetical protein